MKCSYSYLQFAKGLQDDVTMIDKGFWGVFIKSFEESPSKRRKKRSTTNGNITDVKIDTVVLMADETNVTDLENAITNAPNLTAISGSVKGISYKNRHQIFTTRYNIVLRYKKETD